MEILHCGSIAEDPEKNYASMQWTRDLIVPKQVFIKPPPKKANVIPDTWKLQVLCHISLQRGGLIFQLAPQQWCLM